MQHSLSSASVSFVLSGLLLKHGGAILALPSKNHNHNHNNHSHNNENNKTVCNK